MIVLRRRHSLRACGIESYLLLIKRRCPFKRRLQSVAAQYNASYAFTFVVGRFSMAVICKHTRNTQRVISVIWAHGRTNVTERVAWFITRESDKFPVCDVSWGEHDSSDMPPPLWADDNDRSLTRCLTSNSWNRPTSGSANTELSSS